MPRLAPLPEPSSSDIELADIFIRNAAGKIKGAEWAVCHGMDNTALHAIAIAIELLLKSYLLNVATDDDWNRANIGHDLAKALHYATLAGFCAPPNLRRIIDHLHPHFQRGGFQREASRPWPSNMARDAREAGRQLLQAIQHQVRRN